MTHRSFRENLSFGEDRSFGSRKSLKSSIRSKTDGIHGLLHRIFLQFFNHLYFGVSQVHIKVVLLKKINVPIYHYNRITKHLQLRRILYESMNSSNHIFIESYILAIPVSLNHQLWEGSHLVPQGIHQALQGIHPVLQGIHRLLHRTSL